MRIKKQGFKDRILKNVVLQKRLVALHEKERLYNEYHDQNDYILDWQLKRFNQIWQAAKSSDPFYKWWAHEHQLPDKLQSIEKLKEFPVLTKEIMQEHHDKVFLNRENCQTVVTGGSSGRPTAFITSAEEKDLEYANTYVGRGRYGIEPLDPTLLFWGHSHIYGAGLRGQINELKRQALDRLLNISRLNAYDISPSTIATYVAKFIENDPQCIIGYTSSIYSVARYLIDNEIPLGSNRNLKGVIITSETVTKTDLDVIEEAFAVPAIVEYGMAETSVIAYSNPITGSIDVFWDSFIAQADQNDALHVTTLYPRIFPLINYETSDTIEFDRSQRDSILRFASIQGRKRDNLLVRTVDGNYKVLSGIFFVHVVKGFPGVTFVQFAQLKDTVVQIRIVGDEKMDVDKIRAAVTKYVSAEHPNIDCGAIEVVRASEVTRTVAGKVPTVISAARDDG